MAQESMITKQWPASPPLVRCATFCQLYLLQLDFEGAVRLNSKCKKLYSTFCSNSFEENWMILCIFFPVKNCSFSSSFHRSLSPQYSLISKRNQFAMPPWLIVLSIRGFWQSWYFCNFKWTSFRNDLTKIND